MDEDTAKPEPHSITPDLRLITGTEPDFEQHARPERGHRTIGTYRDRASRPNTALREPQVGKADSDTRTL
jgi:hypothetical protein